MGIVTALQMMTLPMVYTLLLVLSVTPLFCCEGQRRDQLRGDNDDNPFNAMDFSKSKNNLRM